MPAYHCESMIAPIEHVGATPVFYRIEANTEIDLPDVKNKLTAATRAVLATHYFGFPQRVSDLRSLCDQHDLVLIEDCAHAFFGAPNATPIGTVGDYAIGSAMKFFPLFDGGLLASRSKSLATLEQFRPSVATELKGLISVIEYAMRYGRLQLISLPLRIAMTTKDLLWGVAKKTMRGKVGNKLTPPSSEGGYSLDPYWINAHMSRVSQFILSNSRVDRICERRRTNYRRIIHALEGTPGMQPLFDALPEGVVPLVVPMKIFDPDKSFPILKRLGVPIWRFGEYLYPQINEHICENSVYLSRHVFQFPCHPELTEKELEWMVETIRSNASGSSTKAAAASSH